MTKKIAIGGQRNVPPGKTIDPDKGLECRHCGCRHMFVVYTRPAFGGRILRRRECRHCGNRMTTWEGSPP